jgi:hypothetical protein
MSSSSPRRVLALLFAGVSSLVAVLLLGPGFVTADAAPVSSKLARSAAVAGDTKRSCVYANHSIKGLTDFGSMVGRNIDCALVYTGSPDWAGWEDPWFLHTPDPDLNWASWVRAGTTTRRQLIISQPLIPSDLKGTNWRTAGAAGAYVSHAKAFAAKLVAAGVGDAIIRLSWEANGDWNLDSIGNSDTDFARWRAFWRQTVIAMRSVPGAHFRFDWCVNNGYRAIPLQKYYPGDDVVDIVGIDAYDSGVKPGQDRWATIHGRPSGLGELTSFARAHGKPLSIPEWGVGPSGVGGTGGDDPAYVDGIAQMVRENAVAYQSYFYKYGWATQLAEGAGSLASYRRHFGTNGDSVGPSAGAAVRRTVAPH